MPEKRKTPSKAARKKPSAKKAPAPRKPQKKGVPVGRTLKTQDKYLPYKKSKVQELKAKRWVVVIDKNTDEELAIVRLTDEKQPNTTHLPTYRKGNRKDTYFKHFVEIEDSEGNAIRVDGKKFLENAKAYDLSDSEIKTIQNVVYHRVKQSQTNNEKIKRLKSKDKKK